MKGGELMFDLAGRGKNCINISMVFETVLAFSTRDNLLVDRVKE